MLQHIPKKLRVVLDTDGRHKGVPVMVDDPEFKEDGKEPYHPLLFTVRHGFANHLSQETAEAIAALIVERYNTHEQRKEKKMDKLPLPTLDKMKACQAESQAIGNFLEWLQEKEIYLCSWDGEYSAIRGNREELLAQYFEIDLKEAEKERRLILDNIRKTNKETENAKGS